MIKRIGDGEVVLINAFTPITERVLAECARLKGVVSCSSGGDHIDYLACRDAGVDVVWFPGYCARTVAEKTMAYILMALNRIVPALENVRQGNWDYLNFIGRESKGRNLAILGYGKTGQFVARFAESFGFAIRHTNSQTHLEEVEEILSTSDIVTMHMALNAQTRAFLNARRLQLLKKDVIIINTSRGALIDEPALAQFCSDHSRAIAFLDVLSIEPPASDNPLRRLKNVHLTPHTGWNSEESDEYLAGATYAALERMLLASS